MSGRLVGLNKFPGVRPVVVRETWWRILANCVLMVTGAEAKEACGTEHICGGLEAGIEGGPCSAASLVTTRPGGGVGVTLH